MPKRKPVQDLVTLVLPSLSQLVESEALSVASRSVSLFPIYPVHDEEEEANPAFVRVSMGPPTCDLPIDRGDWMEVLTEQVEATKEFIMSHIPWNLVDRVLYEGVLVGICKAICDRKLAWTPTIDKRKYMREIYALTKFSNLMVNSRSRSLNLDNIPKILRTRMYDSLSYFKGLSTLILGSGSGGWVPDAYSDKFILALPHLKMLLHFSLKYDCTSSVLQVLSESCAKTLRVLDIERSKQVRGDECVDYILAFKQIDTMNLFKTGLEVNQLAKVLRYSKSLKHLERGDFLAEVVEFIEQTKPETVLGIQDFWASEEYFFHSREELVSVARTCPQISKAMIMFETQSCDDLSILNEFPALTNLDLWGGRFYTDGLSEYLQAHGHKLTDLSLVHVEEIDFRSWAIITMSCPNLRKLNLCNCEFTDERLGASDNENAADRLLRREREKELLDMAQPMLELHTLKLISNCSSDSIVFILSFCLNVKHIFLGMNTDANDDSFLRILTKNSLAHLETLSIQKASKKMTMAGVEALINSCPKLRQIKDLTYFGGIHELEVKMLEARIKEENWDLLLGDEKSNFVDPSDSAFVRKIMQDQCPPVPELFMS